MKKILLILALTALAPGAFASCYGLSRTNGTQLNSICLAKNGQVELIGPANFNYSFQSHSDFIPAGKRCIRPSIENDKCFGWTSTSAYYTFSSESLPGGFLDAQLILEGATESAVGTLKFNDIIYDINP